MNRTLSTVIDFVVIPATATAAMVVVASLLPVHAQTATLSKAERAVLGPEHDLNIQIKAIARDKTTAGSEWNEQSNFYEKGDYGQGQQCPPGTSFYTLGKEKLGCMTAYEFQSIRNQRHAMRQQWRQNVLRNIQQSGPTVCTGSTNTYGNYTYGQGICN